MERTERLLDLVALLLDAQEPVSWAELKESFPEDYGQGTEEATERKFERDKAELLELGIPITYAVGDADHQSGYSVARDAYYLPDPRFADDELAVLYAAGAAALASGAFPGQADLGHALRKVAFLAPGAMVTPALRMELGPVERSEKLSEQLQLLWEAAAARKWVEIDYASPRAKEMSTRRVDPYGLVLRRGTWSLVGHCHLRKAVRTFHVHRMRRVSINPAKPKSPDFEKVEVDLDQYVARFPWQHRMHPALTVTVALGGPLSPLAERLFPGSPVRREAERAVVDVEVTYLDGLLRQVLTHAPHARVEAPVEARQRFREMLEKVRAVHRSDPESERMP
jgi:proteasome accessory factor B